tara:strand:- start:50 stop:688 length:639 start_codon:yes stop_codon:yes gene_type:complete
MDSTINNDPFIYIKDNVLDNTFCKHLIDKFENDTRPEWGRTGAGVDLLIKKSKDLLITPLSDWREEDAIFCEIVGKQVNQYNKHLNDCIPLTSRTTNQPIELTCIKGAHGSKISDCGYGIQKTKAGDGYTWHDDFCVDSFNGIRHVTYIFYLNEVDEGWTQFYNGNQVQPKTGRLLLFPSTWTYIHQGYPPKQDKYIVTGWVSESIEKVTNQ